MANFYRVNLQNLCIESQFFISYARACRSPVVFLDTEFPGTIHHSTKHHTLLSSDERYALLKQNVDELRPIQVGITLSHCGSAIHGSVPNVTWQFDLRDFDLRYHPHAPDSIALLESSGINLEDTRQLGIHSTWLAQLLIDAGLIGLGSTATWVAFHGCYDFAILLKALFQLMRPPWMSMTMPAMLPETLDEFMTLTRCLFGCCFYDLKCVMRRCDGLYGGLERTAKQLNVERAVGKAHQAGSDSLLTCHVFLKIKKMFFTHGNDGEEEEMPFEGVLFGLGG